MNRDACATATEYWPHDSLEDLEVVVGLKQNGDVSASAQQDLVRSSGVLLYKPTDVVHLRSQGIKTVHLRLTMSPHAPFP